MYTFDVFSIRQKKPVMFQSLILSSSTLLFVRLPRMTADSEADSPPSAMENGSGLLRVTQKLKLEFVVKVFLLIAESRFDWPRD